MGQKINPIAFRLGVNRGWDSIWFAKKKEFGKFLIEDFKIRKYIQKNIVNSGVSDIVIERSGKKLIVSIFKEEILILFIIFLILNFFSSFFSNSFHTTPVSFDLPKGTTT